MTDLLEGEDDDAQATDTEQPLSGRTMGRSPQGVTYRPTVHRRMARTPEPPQVPPRWWHADNEGWAHGRGTLG